MWQQHYAQGKKQSEVEKIRKLMDDEGTGTTITFTPDFSVFEAREIDVTLLYNRLRELAMLLHGTTIRFEDKRSTSDVKSIEFNYPDGTAAYVKHLNRDFKVLHSPIVARETLTPERDYKPLDFTIDLEIAIQYVDSQQPMMLCFLNTFDVEVSGVIVDGFIEGLDRFLDNYAQKIGLVEQYGWYSLSDDNLGCGLTVVISLWHPKPSYGNAIRRKVINPEIEAAIYDITQNACEAFAETHPDEMRRIIEKCLANKAQREQRRFGR